MAVLWLLRLIALAAMFTGIGLLVNNIGRRVYERRPNPYTTRAASTAPEPYQPRFSNLFAAILAAVGFVFTGLFFSAVYVPATSIAVVENTTTGHFSVISSGIHVWPLQSDLVPFASKTTTYSLRQQRIEIGTQNDDENDNVATGVASGSNSPGNPVVYIQARGWAIPNKDRLITLHRRYGHDYLDTWVERNWVTAVKTVQGQEPYDYLIKSRQAFADAVETTLQSQLLDSDNTPLVEVSQLAVTNFDFDKQTNQQLHETAKKQFEQQRAREDVAIATQNQAKQKVQAQTKVIEAQKAADARRIQAGAEADAVRAINDAIREQGESYLQLQWIEKWNGTLPQVQTGSGNGTLLQLPMPANVR